MSDEQRRPRRPVPASRAPDGHYRYTYEGEEHRVVVAGDVVALPNEQWCGEGYGTGISEEWLFHSGGLPKAPRDRQRLWAYLIRRALADHHGYSLVVGDWPWYQVEGSPPERVFRG